MEESYVCNPDSHEMAIERDSAGIIRLLCFNFKSYFGRFNGRELLQNHYSIKTQKSLKKKNFLSTF